MNPKIADRFTKIELSLIRQINALATPLSVNLGIGEPNIEPDEMLREFARSAAATGSWRYTPNAGTIALRKLVGQRAGVEGTTDVCITAGTEEALFSIMQAYVDPGDEVLVPNPGFVAYATLARISGGVPVPYNLEPPDWRLDLESLLSRITPRTKMIVVNSPSNPLGSVIPRETLAAIAHAGPLVVSDEVYGEIWYDERPESMLGMGPNALVVNGLSKSHSMTGLRLGWVVGREELIKPVLTAHQHIATCASAFSQTLAEKILSSTGWNQEWLEGIRSQFRRQRKAALSAIERELVVAIEPPAGAFYAFVPVPSCDTLSFARSMAMDAAVLVIPGVAFGALGEGFIRVSYAASVEQIGIGIERLGRALRLAGR